MAKKYANKSRQLVNPGARSSVGRAPQWHTDGPGKSKPSDDVIQFSKDAEVIEIPDGWEPAAAMRMRNGRPEIYRVLVKSHPSRLESGANGTRRKKSA